MRKRWFASSTLALAVAVSLAPIAIAADPSPSPSVAAEEDFLLLPSYDLVPVNPPSKVRIGDQVDLKVAGFAPQANEKGETLPYSLEPAPANAALEDQGWDVLPLRSSGSELKLSVVALKKGELTLGSIIITDGAARVGRTNPFTLEVQSSISADDPEPTKPADLRPPAELPFPIWIVVLAGAVVLILLGAIIYGLVRLSRRGKRALPPVPAAPPKPEDVVALAALDSLEREAYWLKQQFKPHYFGISETLKSYLAARYGFDARESTSRELVRSLEAMQVSDKVIDRIESLFARLDLVKFTEHQPMPDEARELLDVARKLVFETRKPPAPTLVPASLGQTTPRKGGA